MGLRELLILVLILAIVGVILRGLYVALRARRGQLRMALEKNIPNYDPDELSLSELPNGGARMVERSFAEVVRQNSEFSARDRARSRHNDANIPVLMDSVDDDEPAPERSSSVANARQAARKKHLLGTRQPLQQKPTHRPIDRMKARDAAAAAAASAAGYGQARDSGDEYSDEAQPATEYDEVLNPPPYEQETPVDRPQDYAEEIGDEFDDSFAARREPDLDEFDEDSPEQDFDDDEPDDFDERFDDD